MVSHISIFVPSVDDTGRITIWNMAPVMDAKDEVDENVPKMLCLLDNHSGLHVTFFSTKFLKM